MADGSPERDEARLLEVLRAHAPAGSPARETSAAQLLAALARARAAYPAVALDEAAFVGWLAPRAAAPLETLPLPELLLAWACARGDREALRELDARYLSRLAPSIARVDPAPQFRDDVLQQLREKLLVGGPGSPPRLGAYEGSGPLLSWLRAAAVRTALNARRPAARDDHDGDEALEALPLTGTSPELAVIRTQHRAVFSEAFREALAALTSRERNVLRLQALDGLSLEQIGEVYGVNKSTVSRWLARVHEALLAGTREGLARRLSLDDRQLDSLLEAMRSNLELSMSRLLRTPGG